MSAFTRDGTATPGTELARSIGLHGRVAVYGAMAGGVALGGFLVALMILAGALSANALFLTSSGLFLMGAILGLGHGAVLGFLGREPEVTGREALSGLLRSLLYAVPALAVAWLVTIWVGMVPVAAYLGRVAPWVGVGAGWVAGLVILGTGVHFGWRALGNAYARWPERGVGTVLTASVFAALLVTFLADRPELWGLRLRVTEVGAVILAVAATLWIAGPMITAGLHLLRRLPGRVRLFHEGTGAVADVGLGLVTGLVLALLMIPFSPTAGVVVAQGGLGGIVVLALSQALVDEVLLRLFLVTSVAWLVMRWQRASWQEAAVVSVGVATLVQVLLYLPGVAAVGFPTTLAATGFTLVAVLIPAAVFGALFWARGLGSALVADATALAGIAILVL